MKQAAILISLAGLTDYLFFRLELVDVAVSRTPPVLFHQLVMGVFIGLVCLTLSYRVVFDLKSSRWRILFSVGVCIGFSHFLSGRWRDITEAYEQLMAKQIRIDDRLHYIDGNQTWRGVPHAKGNQYYRIGDSLGGRVEVAYDSLGHRTVPESLLVSSDTVDLFLGCSFTFAHNLKAEEGYAHLVTRSLNHRLMNAAMSGYGLVQMRFRMDSLLPKYSFRHVFIQLSPWLSSRSMNICGHFANGYFPAHYFTLKDNELHPVLPYYSFYMKKDVVDWIDHRRSYADKIHYALTNGCKYQVLSYLRMRIADAKVRMGLAPAPLGDKFLLERLFYEKAIEDVRKAGAIPVLVRMYWKDTEFAPLAAALEGKALIVDGDRRMDSVAKALHTDAKSLYRIYREHAGRKLYYDAHPNVLANRVIADAILSRMSEAR